MITLNWQQVRQGLQDNKAPALKLTKDLLQSTTTQLNQLTEDEDKKWLELMCASIINVALDVEIYLQQKNKPLSARPKEIIPQTLEELQNSMAKPQQPN